MKKIYISIPITGLDIDRQREKADILKAALSKKGWQVVNPFEIIPDVKEPTWFDHMKADLEALSKCDAIFMCNGWKESKGCKIEMSYALDSGIRTLFETVEEPQIYYR